MHIVEAHRNRNILVFIVSLALSLFLGWNLFLSPQSLSNGLWMPILLALFLALSFFSFQNIFYRRDIKISEGRVQVSVMQLFKKLSHWEVPVLDYERLSLRWYFPSRIWAESRLRLILEHSDPNKSIVLFENPLNEPVEKIRIRAKDIHEQIGTKDFFDESDRVE